MNQISSRYDLSVIIPLDDDHGFGEPCVNSWNEQTHPRSRVQLVMVDPGNRRELVQRVRPRLAPHDIVVTVPSDNEGLLYERGARAAEADVVVMTEGHCIAEPYAAAEILRLFEDPEIAAINAGSTHIEPTIIARQQSLLEHEWIALWPAGHWRTISLRGFAIRRQVYQELGGFRPEHRRFCANAFAIELERRGLRMAPTSSPIIRHCNSPTVWDVVVTLRDAARGQIVWRTQLQDQEAPDIADRYIGGLDLWSRRGDFAPGTARMLGGSLFQSICADLLRPGGFQKAKHSLAALPRLVLGMVAGPRASGFAQRLALSWAILACTAARIARRHLLAPYRRLWCKSFDSGFADYAAAQTVEPKWFVPRSDPVAAVSIPDGSGAGFHARERWGDHGPLIRWSGCVFLLRLSLSPEKSHRITLDIRSDLPVGQRCLKVRCNGSLLPQKAVTEECERIVITLPANVCRSDGRQDLVFTCNAVRPSDRGEADRRRLGIALFSLKSD
jgi:hypothetical protein